MCVWVSLKFMKVLFLYLVHPFSSPELKAQMSFSDLFFVRCLSSSSLSYTFYIFIFSPKTTGSTKLGSKRHWVKRIQICSNKRLRPIKREDDFKIIIIIFIWISWNFQQKPGKRILTANMIDFSELNIWS